MMSVRRRRWRTRARSTACETDIEPPCNATSTTGRLLAGGMRLSLWRRSGEPTQAAALPHYKPPFRARWTRKGRHCGALSVFVIRSVRHREDRLAARVLDLRHPILLDVLDDIRRHRDVVEGLGHLAAVLVRPGEELERLAGGRCIDRLLVDEDPRRRGHRPRFLAGLVGEDHAVAGPRLPVRV